ncbi:MAG: Bug family tripartite tricarboxylate transporter substrate binding protein [Burkholderiales bacterium]
MRIAVLAASALLGVSTLAESTPQWIASAPAAQAASTGSRQAYPARPVRLIVSNTPGSPSDVIARLLGAKLSEAWAHQVVIDNRPGATGLIAAETTARAAPDGYTLWMNTMTQLISTLQAQRHLLAKDFAPVSLVASTPFLIVVGPAVPVKSLAELIAYGKARPGQLTYASSGQWGSSHLCMESFNSMAGLTLLHVPYKGSSLAMNDIVAGHVHVYCPGAPGVPAFAQTGKLRTLGVTYQKPTPLAPGVPPVADTLPGFELLGWYGIEAPLQTPKPLIAGINAEIVKALKTPELQEQLNKVGAEAVGSSPAEFQVFLRKETERWDKVLRDGGTQLPGRG